MSPVTWFVVVRVVAISAVVILCAASLAAGCADSDQGMDAADGAKRLAVEDLRPLVTLSPNATGWSWDVEPQTHLRTPPPPKLDEAEPSYAIQKALYGRLLGRRTRESRDQQLVG